MCVHICVPIIWDILNWIVSDIKMKVTKQFTILYTDYEYNTSALYIVHVSRTASNHLFNKYNFLTSLFRQPCYACLLKISINYHLSLSAMRTFAPSKESDQPAHSRRLIRIFSGRILDSQGCKVASYGHRKYKWRYPGNATITKHSLSEAPKQESWGTNKDSTNATYETTHAQKGRTATEEPPWNGQ